MMPQVLVSIVMPVYNAEDFLDRSIGSVLRQSYTNIQLILVNDGSTDRSETLCNKYALSDKRVYVIAQDNRGPAAARNTGVRCASGDFIFFLDADDFIDDEAIEILIANYYEHQPDMVMANFRKIENNGAVIKQSVAFHPEAGPFEDEKKVLYKTDIMSYVSHFLKHPSNHLISYCWGRLYKASVIKDKGLVADESMRLFEDFVFNLEYLKHTDKIIFVNKALYVYAMHNSHLSASMAIVNSESLLHDMNVFRMNTAEFFGQHAGLSCISAEKEIGHALVHYVIIFMVRSCRSLAKQNRRRIYEEIDKLVNSALLRDCLSHYSPSKGNSIVLPLLIRLKLTALIILVCRLKAYKRYGGSKGE